MEIVLEQGDRIKVPSGCIATIKENEVIFEEAPKFKKGDVIVSLEGEILLVDEFTNDRLSSYVNIRQDGTLCDTPYNQWNQAHDWNFATEEEWHLLFGKMEEKGLCWNAKEKSVEKIRWRAKEGEDYYCITERGHVVGDEEGGLPEDIERYEFGNYFRTREQAKKAVEVVRGTLRKFHEENE